MWTSRRASPQASDIETWRASRTRLLLAIRFRRPRPLLLRHRPRRSAERARQERAKAKTTPSAVHERRKQCGTEWRAVRAVGKLERGTTLAAILERLQCTAESQSRLNSHSTTTNATTSDPMHGPDRPRASERPYRMSRRRPPCHMKPAMSARWCRAEGRRRSL